MNNQPKVNAFNSFCQQGNDFFAAGNLAAAREMFLKAAELANEISVGATTYEARMEYHNLAIKMLNYAKNDCIKKPERIVFSQEEKQEEPSVKPENQSGIKFLDVAGLEDVKEQIRFKVIEPMKNPKLAEIYHITPGAKILLYGPPGTGKTFIARAIAGEVEAIFYAVNCQDLISKFMGDSSKRLDALFNEALKNERAIIFFDEFDSVASKREDSGDGVDAEMARFVATFLTKVDGFKKSTTNKMLLLIAATNRPWALDPAMLRGGRFDTHIYVGVPDKAAREFLVKKALQDIPLDREVNLEALAESLKGYGGGDITSICDKIRYNAFMKASRAQKVCNVSLADCRAVLSSVHNMISDEDIAKFERFRDYGKID